MARVVAPVAARGRPGAGGVVTTVDAATAWSGEPTSLLVLGSATVAGREWLRVLLPIRPVGASGWIPRSHAVLSADPTWVELHIGSRTVTAYRHGRRVLRARAVVGAAATPTPAGLAAVYERDPQPDPHGFLGPWALPLTALSGVLRNFGGGPGRIAIHGRDGASLLDPLGSARSHGCIRIANRAIRRLVAIAPAGTPVQIDRR